MKIHYGENYTLEKEVRDGLVRYDIGNPDIAGSGGDGVLDDYEIGKIGGVNSVVQYLAKYCLEILPKPRGSIGDYDIVSILTGDCTSEVEDVTISQSHGVKKYPGVIIEIPGGQFEMGLVCKRRKHNHDEHNSGGQTVRVTMTGFRISKTEVTVLQYIYYLMESLEITREKAIRKLPDYKENRKGDNFPVVGLTVEEMTGFANFYGGRLPSAAQIEYVSKGPSHTDQYGTPIDRAIHGRYGGHITTAEVCGPNDERANGWGVCDLAGNVWETTSDRYDRDFYDWMNVSNPSNPYKAGNWLEYRGGSYCDNRWHMRATNRYQNFGEFRTVSVGFRVVWPQS